MKTFLYGLLLGSLLSCGQKQPQSVIVAYVTSWSEPMPDPETVTHINYAFGHVSETFDGLRIENRPRLKAITRLKEKHPGLSVLLSVGGWESGGFSEMARDSTLRNAFAAACAQVADTFGLDGIDIDWEYPGSSAAGISASPEDKANYTLLMRDLRSVLGKHRLLTLASQAGAGYIDFPAILPYIDFVNIMAYDIDNPPYHHAGLYRSNRTSGLSADEAVQAHLEAGIPAGKLVLGVPFYGRGRQPVQRFVPFAQIEKSTRYTRQWDDTAKAPYLTEADSMVCSYENERSIAHKCSYVRKKGLLGIMYWSYDGDDEAGTLRKTVAEELRKKQLPDER